MNQDEVNKAAERRRKHLACHVRNGDLSESPYWEEDTVLGGYNLLVELKRGDDGLLADAYLADRDQTPVDAKWMEMMGFPHILCYGSMMVFDGKSICVEPEGSDGLGTLIAKPTRGQVLQLLRCLGVERKDG